MQFAHRKIFSQRVSNPSLKVALLAIYDKNQAVRYYSRSGNTKILAEGIADAAEVEDEFIYAKKNQV